MGSNIILVNRQLSGFPQFRTWKKNEISQSAMRRDFSGGSETCPRGFLNAGKETPATGLVIAVGDVTGTHPDHLVLEMCADALNDGGKSWPTYTLGRIEPLPMGIP